ncbi:MAG: hypothetical protein LBT55_07660 [Clostridiaceae bacterium]|jgi:hypothetical protein|nr:hypothetical protein [Clostridiaceae bacterium]
MSSVLRSGIAKTPEKFTELGIEKRVSPREDGFRTGGVKGTYEWWYFDAHADDGTALVIVFYTKRMMSPGLPLSPYVTVDLDTPDGKHFEERVEIAGIPFSSSTEGCDVTIGDSYIRSTPDGYEIYFKNDLIEAKATLKANVSPWRPETGHIFFGDRDEKYFAWLPFVPEGDASFAITVGGKTTTHSGTGYHDHNWGNEMMTKLMHRWYWGRAKVGGYQVIASYITGEKRYSYNKYPVFMLAKDGKIIADDTDKLTYSEEDAFTEKATGKPVHNKLVYDYRDGGVRYRVTFNRKGSIINFRMIEQLKGIVRFLATLIGFSGAYHRFTGDVTVEKFTDGVLEESVSAPALWELMYFGKVPKRGM